MKHNGAIVNEALSRSRLTKKELAKQMGILPQNLLNVLKKPYMYSHHLEGACRALNLDPMMFFDYRPEDTNSGLIGKIEQTTILGSASVDVHTAPADLLMALIKEKDERIAALENSLQVIQSLIKQQE